MPQNFDELRALDARHVWRPFTQAGTAPPSIIAVSAKGATITAADGREYLDAVSSWWVNLHGHGHPVIAKAIADQAAGMEQVIFADFTHAPAARLAARVAGHLPGDLNRVFFSDDGSTAVEVALKMARQYWSNQGQDRRAFVAFSGGYHGDTVGAMSAGRSCSIFSAWENMLFPVEIAPFPATWDGDGEIAARERRALAALDEILERNAGKVAGIIIEPLVQGAAGMRMCRPEFLQAVEARTRAADTLLILDEVMTGFGRTGDIFACVKAAIQPDFICLSKGLTGGFVPMALTVTREVIYQAFVGTEISKAFLHGHSYTANPIGCAAGLASLDLLEAPECRAKIRAIEDIHRQRLPAITRLKGVSRPRICGTIAAFDLPGDGYGSAVGARLKQDFLDRGLLLRPLGNVLYLLPPYCIEGMALHRAWDIMEDVLSKL